jgi:hypothetical protein
VGTGEDRLIFAIMTLMRRVSASLLALTFVVSLLAPIVLASPSSTLPACCRRDGKHHCGMGAAKSDSHSGAALKAAKVRCAEYPFTGASPILAKVAPPSSGPAIFASLASHPTVHAQTEARQRVSFTRTCQKRGPPSLLA